MRSYRSEDDRGSVIDKKECIVSGIRGKIFKAPEMAICIMANLG